MEAEDFREGIAAESFSPGDLVKIKREFAELVHGQRNGAQMLPRWKLELRKNRGRWWSAVFKDGPHVGKMPGYSLPEAVFRRA